MKYTSKERQDIAKEVYGREISIADAAVKYELNISTVKGYLRMYRAENHLPPRQSGRKNYGNAVAVTTTAETNSGIEEFESMTKEELIRELVKARVNDARLKKGYEVKGVGAEKEFVHIGGKNTK